MHTRTERKIGSYLNGRKNMDKENEKDEKELL